MSEEAVGLAETRSEADGAGDRAIDAGVEAILLSTDKPVSAARLAEALGVSVAGGAGGEESGESAGGAPLVREAVARLNSVYAETGRSFRIESVAGGYRVMTLARFAKVIAAFQGGRSRTTLSHAALETLAIISYKQPITRARLEAIRGVACGEILRSLIDRRLVTVAGRAEELGRPILYATTKRFLETFGLASLRDLPTVEELRPQA
jgi:segregation and condensation protein B